MLGILVHGDNHFVVAGPRPDCETAHRLARQWSVIQIGGTAAIPGWKIRTKAFRENLEWAVVVEDESENSQAVVQLLAGLASRGIVIQKC